MLAGLLLQRTGKSSGCCNYVIFIQNQGAFSVPPKTRLTIRNGTQSLHQWRSYSFEYLQHHCNVQSHL